MKSTINDEEKESLVVGLGLSRSEIRSSSSLANSILTSFENLGIRPEDYPDFANQLAELSVDIDQAYNQFSQKEDDQVESAQRFYSSHVKECQELEVQIKSSGDVLASLSTFLSQFQADLSSVSTSIAELQGRSRLIDTRLGGRRLLENTLTPYINNNVVPPSLIDLIMTTNPGEPWLEAIESLEIRLTSAKISNLESRSSTDSSDLVADKLRLVAAHKIRTFFINSLEPFRNSITTNLQIIQSSLFLKYQSLFAFLQRHSARIAHEVQKAYVGTARWYFETGLRRYVRALEKIKSRGWIKIGPVAQLQSTQIPLDSSVVLHSKMDTTGVILAYMAESQTYKQPPEALFRSLSLVVADNSASEFNFVSNFFGPPRTSSIDSRHQRQQSRFDDPNINNSNSFLSSQNSNYSSRMNRKSSVVSSIGGDSDSVITGSGSEVAFNLNNNERKSQTAVDLVWKQVVEPVFEYHKMFTAKFLNPNDMPDTASLYSMIKLNESILSRLGKRCQSFESHFISIKLQLWPIFQIRLNNEIDCMNNFLKKLTNNDTNNNNNNSKRIGEEEELRTICNRYVWLFCSIISMGSDEDDDQDELKQEEEEEEEEEDEHEEVNDEENGEGSTASENKPNHKNNSSNLSSGNDRGMVGEELKVINDLIKLRSILVEAIKAHSIKKFNDGNGEGQREKIRAYLNSIYSEIQSNFTDGKFDLKFNKSQNEIAFWRELVWKTRSF